MMHDQTIRTDGSTPEDLSSSPNQVLAYEMPLPGHWQYFHIGFWFLMLSSSVLVLMKTRWKIDSIYLSAPLLSIGMFFLLFTVHGMWRRAMSQLGSVNRFLFLFLLYWGLFTVVRDLVHLDLVTMRNSIGHRLFAWTWFVPLLMLLPMDARFLSELLRNILQQTRMGLFLLVVVKFPPISILTDFTLTWGGSALMLFWHQLSKWGKRTAIAGALVTLFFAFFNSERHAMVGHGFLLLGAAYILMNKRHLFTARRRAVILSTIAAVLGITYYIASNTTFTLLDEESSSRVETFKEELVANTRVSKTGVSIYEDFLNDLDTVDLIIGRGAAGTYLSKESGGINRVLIECGYCQVVLKGGVVMLAPILLLAVPAMLKGFFRSKNWVVKGFALIVAGWLGEMIPYGLPAAFPRYALFWIAIGVCLNQTLREMTDDEIAQYLPDAGVGFSRGI